MKFSLKCMKMKLRSCKYQTEGLQKIAIAFISNLIQQSWFVNSSDIRAFGWEYGPHLLGPKEIDGLLVPPGKAFD